MTRVALDLDRLADLVDRMESFHQHLARAHDEVTQRVADLLVTWDGDAATAQAVAQQEWSAAVVEVHSALAVLRGIGATAHANYCAAVAANRRMWAQ